MKKLFYILLFIPVLALAQSQDQNYVKTTIYKKPTSLGSVDTSLPANATIQVSYYDGLGRPIQQVAHKQSDTGKDIVTPIEYDGFGRQVKDYLPYVPTTAASQDYKTDALTATGVFGYPTYSGQNPFSEKELENSPLNRVFKQAAPGDINSWAKGSGHEIKFDYQTNLENEVKLFVATADGTNYSNNGYYAPTLTQTTTYQPNQLYKTITYDENSAATPVEGNGSTVEFKDKEGRVVLKRTYSTVGTGTTIEQHDTYYVYDQYGNLTFVIPPKVDTSVTISNDVLNNLCYQYRYDYRKRLVEKKLPGKQWEFIVYDKLDRVIATGPAFSPFSDLQTVPPAQPIVGWMITKYDVFNRPIITCWMQSTTVTSAGRKTLQNLRNADTVLSESKIASTTDNTVSGIAFRYSVNAFPSGTTGYYVLSVNYYDDYNYLNAPFIPTSLIANQSVYYNMTTKPKGLTTGTVTRIPELTTTTPVKAESSYSLYDNKARAIRTYTKNHLGGFTQVDTNYETMTGRVNYTTTTHNRSATTSATLTIQDNFNYTDQDRLLTHTQTINGVQPPQLIAENSNDELGQLISKKVGETASNPLQKIDYTYNIRGWLSEINKTGGDILTDPNPLQQGTDPKDLFAFKINYNNVQNENGFIVNALYNGNIGETYWRSSSDNIKRKYSYQYDELNRLRNAVYHKPDLSVAVTQSYNETLDYDKNGNIMHLFRNGNSDVQNQVNTIDNLTYYYQDNNTTNRLVKVTDIQNSSLGFDDDSTGYNDTVDDYSYDLNGNMISDQNKGITSIKYNHLNLPTEIIFNNNANTKITYIYNANGLKVQKIVKTSGLVSKTTDYLAGGFQYLNMVLKFFPHAEGYVNNTVVSNVNTYNYVFNYTDHLGNMRLSYSDSDKNGIITNSEIMEENHYYPFGLKHTSYNTNLYAYAKTASSNMVALKAIPVDPIDISNLPYKYKYNGKELQDELGLNLYDYGARNYDAAIGRWMNIDPLAETSRRFNPYAYALDNPVYFIDPDGMQATYNWEEHDKGNKGVYTDGDKNVSFETALAQATGNEGGNGGEDPPKKGRLDEIVTIRGQKYHKNTSNLFASIGNKVNSFFGGDSDYFVEHKPYDPVEEKMLNETISTGAGMIGGGLAFKGAGKLGGALLSRIAPSAGMTTVGRWMSLAEYETMQATGSMIEGAGGQTFVSTGGPNAFTAAAKGSVYVEFQVPTNSLLKGGVQGWYKTIGPNAGNAMKTALTKQGGQITPTIQKLSPILQVK